MPPTHANEVQGVLAHELGHITGGHVIRFSEGVGNASNISLLTLCWPWARRWPVAAKRRWA